MRTTGAPSGATRTRGAGKRALLLLTAAVLLVAAACDTRVPPVPPAPPLPRGCDVGVLGDSLTVGAAQYLGGSLEQQDCTLAWADGIIGRRTEEGVAALLIRKSREELPAVLVVGLGTNDRYQQDAFPDHVDSIMDLAAGRPVVWIEVAYTPIKANLNAILRSKAEQYGNLTIMEWDGPYWANESWRSSDEVHMTPLGYQMRAEFIAVAAQRVAK